MLYDFWVFSHSIGLHFYAIPTVAIVVAGVVTAIVHHHRHKKRDEEFEQQLKEKIEGKEA